MNDKHDISAEHKRAKQKASNKAYWQANKDKEAARKKAWKAANPDYYKAYRESNREKLAAQGKAYYNNNKEACDARNKAWKAANPDKVKAGKRAYNKNKVDETWEEIYKNLGTKCSCKTCRYDSKFGLEVDHIIPAKKGPHSKAPRGGVALRRYIIKHGCWNDFQLLCGSCNKLKHRNGGTCNCGEGRPNQPNSTALWLGSIQVSDLAMAFLLTQRN